MPKKVKKPQKMIKAVVVITLCKKGGNDDLAHDALILDLEAFKNEYGWESYVDDCIEENE